MANGAVLKFERKAYKVGGTIGITIPKQLLIFLEIKPGNIIVMTPNDDQTITIQKKKYIKKDKENEK